MFNSSIRAIFYQSDLEVIFDYEPHSAKVGDDSYTYLAILTIANTGDEIQENVNANLAFMPPLVSNKVRILNMSSVEKRDKDPIIKINTINEGWHASIKELAPGTLVEINFLAIISKDQVKKLGSVSADIHAEGYILQGDPRSTKLARIFSDFL